MTNDLALLNGSSVRTMSSLKNNTVEEKKALYNATEKANFMLKDCVNKEINLMNVYIEEREKDEINQETGEIRKDLKYRIILFDDKNVSYVTGSYGIANSLAKIFQLFGKPEEWSEPIPVKVVNKTLKDNKTSLSLEIL